MKRLLPITLIPLTLLAACTPRHTIQPQPNAKTLDAFDALIIGTTTEAEVLQRWGEPTVKIPVIKETIQGNTWIYCNPVPCSMGRPSILIDKTSHVVHAASWELQPEDSDVTFKKISARYPQARFIQKNLVFSSKELIERVTVWSAPEMGITLTLVPNHPETIQTIRKTAPAIN